jgi:hypothetical protein
VSTCPRGPLGNILLGVKFSKIQKFLDTWTRGHFFFKMMFQYGRAPKTASSTRSRLSGKYGTTSRDSMNFRNIYSPTFRIRKPVGVTPNQQKNLRAREEKKKEAYNKQVKVRKASQIEKIKQNILDSVKVYLDNEVPVDMPAIQQSNKRYAKYALSSMKMANRALPYLLPITGAVSAYRRQGRTQPILPMYVTPTR